MIWGLSFLLLLKVVAGLRLGRRGRVPGVHRERHPDRIALVSSRKLAFGRRWPLAVVGATTVAGQLVGLNIATPRIGTAMAAIFVGTIPLFSMVIGQIWGLEHITRIGRVGLALGFAGIVLLVGFPADRATKRVRAWLRLPLCSARSRRVRQ